LLGVEWWVRRTEERDVWSKEGGWNSTEQRLWAVLIDQRRE
jgi:hypothetical protein